MRVQADNTIDKLIHDDDAPCEFRNSPNQSGEILPRFVVIHYTAGGSAEGSVSWLTNSQAKASAHLVIARDGSITQLVGFNRKAWHAGASNWAGLSGLNSHSIGIELDNAGRLTRHPDGWVSWFGKVYPDAGGAEAVHKHETVASGWHRYTEDQLRVAAETCACLVEHYDLEDVIGHDDIAPKRKSDPGPLFPMDSFRARVLGRNSDDGLAPPPTAARDDDRLIETTASFLNIRTGPGTQHSLLPEGPLPQGTALAVVDEEGSWLLVDVLSAISNSVDIQGWVHGRFTRTLS